MSYKKNNEFKAAVALEKLYYNRGFSHDAFAFHLTDEKPKKLRRKRTPRLKRLLAHSIYRMFTLVWVSLYFAVNIFAKMIR